MRCGPLSRRTVVLAGHGRTVLGAAALTVVLRALLPNTIPVPTLSATSVAQPAVLVAAYIAAMTGISAGAEPSWQIYATAPRRVRWRNVSRVIAVTAALVAVGVWGEQQALTGALCATALVGEGLLAGSMLGPGFAWFVPTVHMVAALALGGLTATGAPAGWAWIITQRPSALSAFASVMLLVVGAATWWWRADRAAARDD